MRLLQPIATIFMALVLTAGSVSSALAEDVTVLDPSGGAGSGELAGMAALSDLQQHLATTGWVNQSGSVMNFSVSTDGQITGTYVNNAAGTGCQGTPYPLTGWVYGNNIAWSVAWTNATANCNSVTAWGGYYDPGTNSLQTSWVLAYQGTSGGGIEQGTDVFTYQ